MHSLSAYGTINFIIKNLSQLLAADSNSMLSVCCEAQARVMQGSARDGSQGERPQSLNPSLELTLKLVVTHPPPPPTCKSQYT